MTRVRTPEVAPDTELPAPPPRLNTTRGDLDRLRTRSDRERRERNEEPDSGGLPATVTPGTRRDAAANSGPGSPSTERTSPKAIATRTVKTGLITGGLAAALVLGTGGTAAVPMALAAGVQGLMAGGGTYLAGEMHNYVWGAPTDERRPGTFGTWLRGLIAPISIPVGIGYNLLAGRRTREAPAST
jgi:hypothetical protein